MLSLTVAVSDLNRELALTDRVVPRGKPPYPVLWSVLMECEDKGAGLRLSATDLEVGLRVTTDAEVAKGGRLCVPAKKLYDLVKLLPGKDKLTIEAGAGNVALSTPSFRAKIPVMAADDYPTLPEPPAEQCELPNAELRQMIARTRFATTADDTRYFLAGVLLELGAGRLQMVGTDGHRLARAAAASSAEAEPVIITRRALDAMSGVLELGGPVTYSGSASHVFFSVAGCQFFTRRVQGKFPEYRRIIPKPMPPKERMELPRDVLTAAVQRAALACDAHTRGVSLGLSSDGLKVEADSLEGQTDELLEAAFKGAEKAFKVNADYMLQFLGATDSEKVTVETADKELSAVVLRQVGGQVEFEYVLMPLRV